MPRRFDFALLVLLVGFSFSLAANIMWTWPGGPVRILGGALASLALPGAIHLWGKVPIPPPLTIGWLHIPVFGTLRALTMGGIAAMAAYTTFSHASSLLVAHGEDPTLAACYPAMTELLVVMGVLARRPAVQARVHGQPSQRKPRPQRSATAPPPPPPPPDESETELSAAKSKREERKAWARDRWPVTTRQIVDEFGCSRSEADRNRKDVAAEMGAAS